MVISSVKYVKQGNGTVTEMGGEVERPGQASLRRWHLSSDLNDKLNPHTHRVFQEVGTVSAKALGQAELGVLRKIEDGQHIVSGEMRRS